MTANYARALGAAEAAIHYVRDMLKLPPRGEETMQDRCSRMLVALDRAEASIARYLEAEKTDG